MLPADSIAKPKIKTKTEKSYGSGDQLLGEFIEKQRNGTRLKFSQICHEFGSKIQHTNFEDFWPFWIVKGFPFLELRNSCRPNVLYILTCCNVFGKPIK